MAENTRPDSLGDSLKPTGSDTSASQVAVQQRATVSRRTAPLVGSTRPTAKAKAPSKPSAWRSWRSTAIMALVVPGLFATVALPAYAFTPSADTASGSSELQALKESGAQSLSVDADVSANAVTRDGYTATTEAELAAAKAAAQAAADAAAAAAVAAEAAANAAAQRASFTTTQKSFTGPSAEDYLSAPAYPNFSLAQVFSVALQYQGVPYVYGGATPAGFDCSGFVKYVYAQFGISMPHSSAGQGAMGTRISEADAQPGDLVIMPGHDGFYAGNGQILHAPYEGASVRVQPIWTSDYYIVRIGI